MKPKLSEYNVVKGSELLCPRCEFKYLHHHQVDIYEREEDAALGLHVEVTNGQVVTDTNLSGNPSSRRDGIIISLWCEGCNAKLLLKIAQHKGVTLIDIVDTGDDYKPEA